MEATSLRQRIPGFWMVILSLWMVISSTGRCGCCAAFESDYSKTTHSGLEDHRNSREGNYHYAIHFNVERKDKKEDTFNNLHWVMVTKDTVDGAMADLRKLEPYFLISNEVQRSFTEHLYCQIPNLHGNEKHTGKHIIQHFIHTMNISSDFNAGELEDIVTKLDCFVDIFKTETKAGKDTGSDNVSQEYDNELQDLKERAAVQSIAMHNVLDKRQRDLEAIYYNNPPKDPEGHNRARRNAGSDITTTSSVPQIDNQSPQSLIDSSLTLSEVNDLIYKESGDLKQTLTQLSLLAKELDNARDSVLFIEQVILLLGNLTQFLSSKEPSNTFHGLLKVSHGPYCSGIIKKGQILEIILEIIQDIKNYTLALEKTEDHETLKYDIENATCEAGELKTFVELISKYMNPTEFTTASEHFRNASLELEGELEECQHRINGTKDALHELTLKKEITRALLAELKMAAQKLQAQTRDQGDDGINNLQINVKQIVGITI